MQKKLLTYIFFLCLSLVSLSFINPSSNNNSVASDSTGSSISASAEETSSSALLSSMLYENLNLSAKGLSKEVLDHAIKGYQKLVSEGSVQNSRYLTLVDLSQSSRRKRMYIVDLENYQLVVNTFVSHGKNSGLDRAERFSNIPESEKSSLGFYVTKQTYSGKHGLSLKLAGLEDGFNDNAESRAIVLHGAEYVNKGRVNSGYMGRSQGCPAVPQAEASRIINLIKGGTALFIYHPTSSYVNGSKILNS